MIVKRLSVLLIVLVMLAVPVLNASAQGGVFSCGTLSDEDCELMQQAEANMNALDSVAVDGTMSFTLSGLEIQPGTTELSLGANFNLALGGGLSALNYTDPVAMVNNLEAVLETLLGLHGQILVEPWGLEVLEMEDLPPNAALDMRFADGILYMNAERAGLEDVDAEWAGVDLAAAYEEEGGLDLDQEQLEELLEMLQSSDITANMPVELLAEYTTYTRLDDADIMDQSMAVFETTLDLRSLILDPDFQAFMVRALDESGLLDEVDLSAGDLQLALGLLTMLLTDFSATTTAYIGLDDGYLHSYDFNLVLDVNLVMVAGLAGDEMQLPNRLFLEMAATADFHSFNEPVEVEVPTDVEMQDIDDM